MTAVPSGDSSDGGGGDGDPDSDLGSSSLDPSVLVCVRRFVVTGEEPGSPDGEW